MARALSAQAFAAHARAQIAYGRHLMDVHRRNPTGWCSCGETWMCPEARDGQQKVQWFTAALARVQQDDHLNGQRAPQRADAGAGSRRRGLIWHWRMKTLLRRAAIR